MSWFFVKCRDGKISYLCFFASIDFILYLFKKFLFSIGKSYQPINFEWWVPGKFVTIIIILILVVHTLSKFCILIIYQKKFYRTFNRRFEHLVVGVLLVFYWTARKIKFSCHFTVDSKKRAYFKFLFKFHMNNHDFVKSRLLLLEQRNTPK